MSKLIYFSILLIFTLGCGVHKINITGKNLPKSSRELYSNCFTDTLLSPIQFNYKSVITTANKTYKLTGLVKANTNNDLWMNVVSSNFGIEILRLKSNNDSLFFIDKINKRYFAGSSNYLSSYIGFDINFCQFSSILLGNFSSLALGNDSVFDMYKVLNINELSTFNFSSSDLTNNNFQQIKVPFISESITLNSFSKVESAIYTNTNTSKSFDIKYLAYAEDFSHPTNFNIVIGSPSDTIRITCKIYKYIKNDNFTFNYKVPSNYALIP